MATPTYDPIASTTLTSSASSVTFSSLDTIAAGYRDLIIVARFNSNSLGEIGLKMNASGFGYGVYAVGNGSSASSTTSATAPLPLTSSVFTDSGGTGLLIAHVFDFAQTDKHKSVLARFNLPTGSSYPGVSMMAGRFPDTSAITSLTLQFGGGQQFQSGNTFAIYGVAA